METMVNFFHVNGYIALGAILAFIVIAHVLIRSWRRHKLSNERQRAVARLRSLERKQPPEGVRPEVAPLHEIEIDRGDNSCFCSDPEQGTNHKLVLHDPTGGQAAHLDVS